MEENYDYKIKVDDILEREINISNLSLNTLTSNCKALEEYSNFIQKYLDVINQYYMSLTELNATFPNFSSSSENELESIIKNIGEILSSTIQKKLNNLLIFLSQSQVLIHSLNQSISYSMNFLENSKKINENVFTNIKTLNNNYYKEYESMINAFEKLENKIIENYIKKHYNKNKEIDENDENILKNCVVSAKKAEESFLNFNKEEIRKYINDYNNNLKNIQNNRNILNKNFYECILNIINNLIEYFNNLLNEMHNENQINNPILNESNEDEDLFNFNITEKEVNTIIFKLFNSKKYNIKIINNKIITQENIDENNKEINSKLLLSEEDIYNIIKEIYNYDFISINKSEYNLENEKEKLKIFELTKKLFSYDSDINEIESISDEEIKTLNSMLYNNEEYILYFFSVLNEYRTKGIYEMPQKIFDTITNIFQESLNSINKNNNYEIGFDILTLSFTFFKMEGKERFYFGDIIKNNKIFKSTEFWSDYITTQIEKDLKRYNANENNENIINKLDDKKLDDILLSKILPSADMMSKFGLDKNEIINIIEPLMVQYQMKEKSKESLLSLVKSQI